MQHCSYTHTTLFFFLNDTATPELYTLSLHDALPISNQNVKKRPACSELRWAYCNHKATYFASYLTGSDCVPDDQRSEERFSRNAETDLVCRLLLAKKSSDAKSFRDFRERAQQLAHARLVAAAVPAEAIALCSVMPKPSYTDGYATKSAPR